MSSIPPLSTLTVVISVGAAASSSSSSAAAAAASSGPLRAAPVTEEEECCSICMETYPAEFPPITLRCKHAFHEACVKEWAKTSAFCPLCRARMELLVAPPPPQQQQQYGPGAAAYPQQPPYAGAGAPAGPSLSFFGGLQNKLMGGGSGAGAGPVPAGPMPSMMGGAPAPPGTYVALAPYQGGPAYAYAGPPPSSLATVAAVLAGAVTGRADPPSVDATARMLDDARRRIAASQEFRLIRMAVTGLAMGIAVTGARIVTSPLAGAAASVAMSAAFRTGGVLGGVVSSVASQVAHQAVRSVVLGTLSDAPRIAAGASLAVSAAGLAAAGAAAAAVSAAGQQQQGAYARPPQQPPSRIVRCPNCSQLLHAPDAPIFRCTCGCLLQR
jgi:hypothetical protein